MTLTVCENVALGTASNRRPFTDLENVATRISDISNEHGLAVDPSVKVEHLSVGERQRVEIIKALYRDAELLVLDEPTAVLTPKEVEDLFVILRRMADSGKGLIFISHKLREVMSLSDRITVLRDGEVVGETTPSKTDRQELAQMMVGRDVRLTPDLPESKLGAKRLTLSDLTVIGDNETVAVKKVSFDIDLTVLQEIFLVCQAIQMQLKHKFQHKWHCGSKTCNVNQSSLHPKEISSDSRTFGFKIIL